MKIDIKYALRKYWYAYDMDNRGGAFGRLDRLDANKLFG